MTGSTSPTDQASFHVGDRVTTVVRNASGETKHDGTIVEDFGTSTAGPDLGRSWAPQRRWGIALDDGRLVFRDTGELDHIG